MMHTDPRDAPIYDGRQVAANVQGIEPSHVARYRWAVSELAKRFSDGAIVLDAACGVGYGSSMLAEAGHSVTGIDISELAIEYARTHYRNSRTIYINGDLRTMELPEVDVIVSFETIEHIAEDQQLMVKYNSVCPLLFASVPNEDVFPLEGPVERHHYRHYTDQDFMSLAEFAGYEKLISYGSIDKWESAVTPNTIEGRYLVYFLEGR